MNKKILRDLGFGKEVTLVNAGVCPTCGKFIDAKKFLNDSSRREYTISGMCQDSVFGAE
jgi:hypothetical protein